jgi:Tfp pilus assembly major pilin PilA
MVLAGSDENTLHYFTLIQIMVVIPILGILARADLPEVHEPAG